MVQLVGELFMKSYGKTQIMRNFSYRSFLEKTCACVLILIIASAAFAEAHSGIFTDAALHPWSTNTDPTDVAKLHVEEIAASTGGTHKYTVLQGGTMDGRNCRSSMAVG
jgi:hypothetical protein